MAAGEVRLFIETLRTWSADTEATEEAEVFCGEAARRSALAKKLHILRLGSGSELRVLCDNFLDGLRATDDTDDHSSIYL